jgi:hypothetical protein
MARVMLAERDMSEGFEESEALMMPVSEMDEERASVFDSAPANLQRAAQPAAAPPRAEIPAPSVVPSTNEGLRQRRDALMEKAAAGITLSGEVRDSATGQPLAGASITVPGTPLGGITDSTGRFRIPNVPAGNVALEAKVLGYADARRIIDLRDDSIPSVRFRLEQHPVTLDQIVVTGEAAAPQRRQLGNALSSIVMAWRPASIAEVRDSLGTEPVVLADATPDSVFMRSIDGRPVVRMVYTVEGEILELEQSRSIAEEDLARREASVDSTSTINVRDLSVTLKGPPALLESFRRRLR